MPLDRISCPFDPCSANPAMAGSIVAIHQLENPNAGVGTTCPASLMHGRALTPDERNHLKAQEHIYPKTAPPPVTSGGPDTPSQPLGRPATNDDPDAWGLGGRADEDVIPASEVKKGIVPQGVAGYEVGGSGMLDEVIGQVNGANAMAGEGVATLNSAKESIDSAVQALEMTMENVQSATLSAAMESFRMAQENIATAQTALQEGQEGAATYVSILQS